MAWDAERKRLLSWDRFGAVCVWEVGNNKPILECEHMGGAQGAAWDPQGKRVLSWGGDGAVRVWDVAANKVIAEVKALQIGV